MPINLQLIMDGQLDLDQVLDENDGDFNEMVHYLVRQELRGFIRRETVAIWLSTLTGVFGRKGKVRISTADVRKAFGSRSSVQVVASTYR